MFQRLRAHLARDMPIDFTNRLVQHLQQLVYLLRFRRLVRPL